jgi:hypothetical protein
VVIQKQKTLVVTLEILLHEKQRRFAMDKEEKIEPGGPWMRAKSCAAKASATAERCEASSVVAIGVHGGAAAAKAGALMPNATSSNRLPGAVEGSVRRESTPAKRSYVTCAITWIPKKFKSYEQR